MKKGKQARSPKTKATVGEFDDYDRRILRCLQKNARMSNIELSKEVLLSAPQCYRRIQKLEKAGVIKGYTAIIDREAMGFDVLAFISVTIDRAQITRLREVEIVMAKFPEVLECQEVTGDQGYQLKVIGKNLKSYSTFLNEKLMCAPGVIRVKSSLCLNEIKYTTVLPVAKESD